MLSPLRNRFGIPGVISVIALVFAMLGGAYAASNDSGGEKASASAKGKKGPRGSRGKTGPAGPAGPAGPQGPAGANGAKGDKGDAGANGTNGAPGDDGKSVEVTDIPVEGSACNEQGGIEVEVEGSGEVKEICNGQEGSPWTLGGTLPPGKTLTGSWAFNATKADAEEFTGSVFAPISFPIKLAASLGASKVHFASDEDFATICPGSVSNPAAPSGHLCVFNSTFGGLGNANFSYIANLDGNEGASRTGALVAFAPTGDHAFGYGSWAVTAP